MYNNNYYPTAQTQYMNRQPSYGLKGRPVTSLEEVRAISVDFDGSISYFPDLGDKKIFTKQINLDGTSTINIYEQVAPPAPKESEYITRKEFEEALQKIMTKPVMETKKQAAATATDGSEYKF